MQMKNQLIATIGQQLHIAKSDDDAWICHTIYSLAGKMALASLWDHDESRNSVSLQHFKERAEQIFTAYTAIYPQTFRLFPASPKDLVEDIYAVYLRTGHFYNSPYKISPAAFTQAATGSVVLYRGISPNAKFPMSGLGFYSLHSKPAKTENALSIAEMFGLQVQTLGEYLEELLLDDNWTETEWPLDAEFLRLEPPFSRGYWQETPHEDGRISLFRYGSPNKLYAFYQFEQNRILQKTIPEWQVNDIRSLRLKAYSKYGEYHRIAVALLDRYKELPPIKVKLEGETAQIRLGYWLPPTEEDFFKLYSWPSEYLSSTQDFIGRIYRQMSTPVYLVFRQHLETIGYHFEEE